jgi:hypothetical protein
MRGEPVADFRAHATASTLLGAAYGGGAYALWHLPPSTCFLAGGLCTLSGLLPDVDSNSSRPLREGLAFAAAIVPMMLADRFQQLGMSAESIVMTGAVVYLFVRFVLGEFLRRFTVHRGMFHSLPAALIFGELAFLLVGGSDLRIRFFKAGAVLIGYLGHLALDELYSLHWHRGRLRLKSSFGTALKLFSHNWWGTGLTYANLALLSYVMIYEPGWMEQVRQGRHLDWAQNWVQEQTHDPGQPAAQPDPQPAEHPVWSRVRSFFPGLDRDSHQDRKPAPRAASGEPRTARQESCFFR